MSAPWRAWPGLTADRRGVVGVEFAAAGLTILILFMVVFDIGFLFMDQRGLDFGVEQTARWGSVNSATLSSAALLPQFQAATSSFFSSSTCSAYSSAASVPANTACYLVVTMSNGAQIGSLLTVQGYYSWSPASVFDGFVAATLTSAVALTINN